MKVIELMMLDIVQTTIKFINQNLVTRYENKKH